MRAQIGEPTTLQGGEFRDKARRGESWSKLPPAPIIDLVGLGPGLTPSGDDFLVGAVAMLDALDERPAHTALARAIEAIPHGLTSPLSESLLKTAASGHVGEHLSCAVSAVISGAPAKAIAAVREIGHGSGWDMLTGILVALRAVVARDASGRRLRKVSRTVRMTSSGGVL